MIFSHALHENSLLRQKIVADTAIDENEQVKLLLKLIKSNNTRDQFINQLAGDLVQQVRDRQAEQHGILAFIRQYSLSTEEGVVLMCLAEALLRIPDAATADKLIKDKLSSSNWQQHLGESHSLFVNASTWGLMLTGKIVRLESDVTNNVNHYLYSLISKSSEPVIRAALKEAMRFMGQQFVISETIEAAIQFSKNNNNEKIYSFDMLGEAAITNKMAQDYFNAYLHAINTVSNKLNNKKINYSNSISIKLSALHPRYEYAQQGSFKETLYPKLKQLIELAIEKNVALTIDAEEANRLDIMLDAFKFMFNIATKYNWSGLGLAVQAYQHRSLSVINWLDDISSKTHCSISVRLVKGAYWDTEIKLAQQLGLQHYPVYSRKENTDLSYLCCAQRLLKCDYIYPQFATHNAHTIASIISYSNITEQTANDSNKFEFQRLYGMGELLYDSLLKHYQITCRIYAPVGAYKSLLPYLVRRLLENGANTSFVQRIEDHSIDIKNIIESPINRVSHNTNHYHPNIPLPCELLQAQTHQETRIMATGIDLTHSEQLNKLNKVFTQCYSKQYYARPLINENSNSSKNDKQQILTITNPADINDIVGEVTLATAEDIHTSMKLAKSAFATWSKTDVKIRAEYLYTLSDLIEDNKLELIALCVREAGRCIPDAISEIREAVDYCRYYADQALSLFQDQLLPGPTGENNILQFQARGIYACISPWNFPIAIFTGQIAAAMVSGNCVLAKPAQQTSLCASKIISLCYQAGIPDGVISFIPSSSKIISIPLLSHPDLSGVVFTGSLASANAIQQNLAKRDGAMIPFVAETSGMNCLIADSSALLEQLSIDVINSAFNSAGQRCSSLRFLYLQDDIADKVIELLIGAVQQLQILNPKNLAADIGPLIDKNALDKITAHHEFLNNSEFATSLYHKNLDPESHSNLNGFYIAPAIYEITHLSQIPNEIFGPILHIIRYQQQNLIDVIQQINDSGYGLTLGVHSRILSTIETVVNHANIGNVYVNRNMIGAVVGVQPFGGRGRSGTGPKAGGPHYLASFCIEKTVSHNTAAIGGNTQLLSLNSES